MPQMKAVVSNAKASWKTTTLGWVTGGGLLLQQVQWLLDEDPATVMTWEGIVAALALLGIGTLARDGDVSSERAGAS